MNGSTVVFMSPGNGCLIHSWRSVVSTGRYDYQACSVPDCRARRVADLNPEEPPGEEAVDVDWVCDGRPMIH